MSKYTERISQGLCGQCGKKSDGKRCELCMKKSRDNNKRYKNERQKCGICRHCKRPAMEGSLFCDIHQLSEISHRYTRRYNCNFEQLVELHKAQHGRCPYSNLPITIGKDAAIDHIIPKSKGGTNSIENYQWVHRLANNMKSDIPHDEFIALCKKIAAYNML